MKKSDQLYKIEFNHNEMKNIEFANIIDILEKSTYELVKNSNQSDEKKILQTISGISALIRNLDRLEKEFRNEVKEVA